MKIVNYPIVLLAAMWLAPAQPQQAPQSDPAPRTKVSKLVDINSATATELRHLPGIGEAEAAKIVAGRPYGVKTELLDRQIVPQATYDTIQKLITARQTPAK